MRADDVIEVVISAPAKVTQIDNGKLRGYDNKPRQHWIFPGSSAVEQVTVNHLVGGSIPSRGANKISKL